MNALKRGQLHHRQHLTFEDDRQHDDVQRLGFAEAGVDLHVVVGRVGDEDALLLERGLADQPLADAELLVEVLALLVRVGRGRA